MNPTKRPGEEFVRILYSRPTHPLPRQAVFRRLKALICLQAGQELPSDASDGSLVVTASLCAGAQRKKQKIQWYRLPIGGSFLNCIVPNKFRVYAAQNSKIEFLNYRTGNRSDSAAQFLESAIRLN